MRTSERLLKRLRAEGVVPGDQEVRIIRTYASGSMRVNGAWSWLAEWGDRKTSQTAGSQWPMADCLAAPVLNASKNEFGEISVDPYAGDGRLYFGKKRRP